MKTSPFLPLIVTAIHFLFIPELLPQSGTIPFDSDRWVLRDAKLSQHLGRSSLTGFAYLKDLEFENGVIEVDIAVDGSRSYPGIIFRYQSDRNYERFYVRPHVANGLSSNALQYTPVINGIAGWQLYSGEGFTGPAAIPHNVWVPLKMEIKGRQARVYLGEGSEPALVINDLKHGSSKGTVGVFNANDDTAHFSNFRYEMDDGLNFPPPPERETPVGTITKWRLSRTYKLSQVDIERTPDEQGLEDLGWEDVQSEPSGLVDIARYRRRSPGESDWIWAKTVITSENGEILRLLFGYSDVVNIFLNGNLLFTGDSAYRSRDPGFQGIVGLNDAVHLPLEAGENELLLLIGESFGGWGFMCRDGSTVFQHDGVSKLWDLPRGLRYPESAVYDPKRDVLYVSNFFSPGGEFLSKVALNGEIMDLKWITRLTRPTGLCLRGNRLFVVERTGLAEIDVESERIVARHRIPGAVFPNDVAVDSMGNLYVSDSNQSVIYRSHEGEFEAWLKSEEVRDPNGLCVDGKELIVGCSGDGCLRAVNLDDQKIRILAELGTGSIVDGVKPDGRGNYIVSDFNGRIFIVRGGGGKTKLLDTTAKGINLADLEYVPEKNLLVIPTLYSLRLMAYELDPPP